MNVSKIPPEVMDVLYAAGAILLLPKMHTGPQMRAYEEHAVWVVGPFVVWIGVGLWYVIRYHAKAAGKPRAAWEDWVLAKVRKMSASIGARAAEPPR